MRTFLPHKFRASVPPPQRTASRVDLFPPPAPRSVTPHALASASSDGGSTPAVANDAESVGNHVDSTSRGASLAVATLFLAPLTARVPHAWTLAARDETCSDLRIRASDRTSRTSSRLFSTIEAQPRQEVANWSTSKRRCWRMVSKGHQRVQQRAWSDQKESRVR